MLLSARIFYFAVVTTAKRSQQWNFTKNRLSTNICTFSKSRIQTCSDFVQSYSQCDLKLQTIKWTVCYDIY